MPQMYSLSQLKMCFIMKKEFLLFQRWKLPILRSSTKYSFNTVFFHVFSHAYSVQVIVGSFMYGGGKSKSKAKMNKEAAEAAEQAEADKQSTPPTSLPSQSHAAASIMGGWTSARNAHVDIDLMRG